MDPQVWLTILAAVGGGAVGSVITAWVSRRNSRETARDARSRDHQLMLREAVALTNPEGHTEDQVGVGRAWIKILAEKHPLSEIDARLAQAATEVFTKPAIEAGRRIQAQGDEVDFVIGESDEDDEDDPDGVTEEDE